MLNLRMAGSFRRDGGRGGLVYIFIFYDTLYVAIMGAVFDKVNWTLAGNVTEKQGYISTQFKA